MKRAMVAVVMLGLAGLTPVMAADNPVSPESTDQVIKPEIDRREITVPHIRAKDFEWGLYLGQYNAESFGVKPVFGARIGYHLSEDFFVELAVAKSTISDESFRTLGIALFTEEKTPLYYYYLSTGVNLFPGEIFLGKGRAWGSTFYLAGGIGGTSFDTFNKITFNVAAGVRILPSKNYSLRIEMREHLYQSDLLGDNHFVQNLELTGGFAMYF